MANQDIIPFTSPHGGHSRLEPYKVAASTTYATAETSWQKGEIVVVTSGAVGAANAVIADSNGTGLAHNPAIHFIANESSQGVMSLPNIASGAATISLLANFIPVRGEQEFMTRNVFTGSDALIVPSSSGGVGGVGDIVGWYRDNTVNFGPNGRFGVDTNLTGLIITRVLNANYEDVGDHGGTGTYVVFKCNGE